MAGKGGMKVGELAKRTGLTVRTLHHYDEISLLAPSMHTASGHRLYTDADIARLQRIVALRQFGFTLEQIRDCLDKPGFSPIEVIRMQIARLTEQIAQHDQLRTLLTGLERALGRGEAASTEQILQTIEVMMTIESYYTPEQLAYLRNRRAEVGEDAIRAAEQEWPELMAKVKAEMEAGTDPSDPKVLALAKRWKELVESFTGGDPGVTQSLRNVWKEQGTEIARQHDMQFDPGMFAYIGKAQAML